MEQFINKLKLESGKDKKELCVNVFKLSKDELDSMLFFGMFNIDTDVEFLEKQLQKMYQLRFESYIQSELEGLQAKYPSGKRIQFELFILDKNDDFVKDRLGGVSAFTECNGKMCFVVSQMKDALSENEAKSLWDKKYETHLYDKGSSSDSYMFGNAELDIPFWAGNSLGYYLVKWFIEKHNNISIEELTLLPSENYIAV